VTAETLRSLKPDGSFDISGQNRNLKSVDAVSWYLPASRESLVAAGENPDKSKSVEIGNATAFAQYSANVQVAVILHELAHAYQDHLLGEGHAEIRSAYAQAMATKLYELVDLKRGGYTQSYAATDAYEYFAELSVTYLARNENFPYTQSDLADLDPVGYQLMQKIWGQPDAVGLGM
jgi:hypothetical protein